MQIPRTWAHLSLRSTLKALEQAGALSDLAMQTLLKVIRSPPKDVVEPNLSGVIRQLLLPKEQVVTQNVHYVLSIPKVAAHIYGEGGHLVVVLRALLVLSLPVFPTLAST
ncbi:hypothetical protein APHDU1_0109 [Anaplasma phagocytophilum]|uniref:hypothetical protein n=1 Tax=Anaplasma phagocytophilum TaxID=948 RepID=UPI0006144998|nr:hypothetical protein [Anaplasma phagocytophilum]KKA00146.1 hypothetical protein APHDU1_0109 [Anaplasma phagocytophilum]